MKTIKVRFFDMEKDGLVQLMIHQRVTVVPNVPHRYKQVGSIEITYEPRPSPTAAVGTNEEPMDALDAALDNKRAFTVAQFYDWVVKGLKAQGLRDIIIAIDNALETTYKKAGVIVFWEDGA